MLLGILIGLALAALRFAVAWWTYRTANPADVIVSMEQAYPSIYRLMVSRETSQGDDEHA